MSFLSTRIISRTTLLYSFLSTLNAIHIIFSSVFMYSTLKHLFFAPVFHTMNTKTLYPSGECANLSCRLVHLKKVSVRISDFIFETAFFNEPFQRNYACVNAVIFD